MSRTRTTTPGNLGQVPMPLRRRSADPMADYDALPPPLRHWLAHADLPWSPASCLRLWRKYRARGAAPDQVLRKLSDLQARKLARIEVTANLPRRSGQKDACFPSALQQQTRKDMTCAASDTTSSASPPRFWA